MELCHIPFENLHVAAINMRANRKDPDISDILPSVRARGILQPLIVRPTAGDAADDYEIVAGRRRYFCAKTILSESGSIEPLPCAVMAAGDDAAALEASLIENVARLEPDEMTQYETFVRLIKEGRTANDLAQTFGITEQMVRRRLALGNLLLKIRTAYRNDEIDAETIRHLTLASKAQQKEWLVLFDSDEAEPRGAQLKQWLFGGQTISTTAALFPLDQYSGQIVTDLFGEDGYFADADAFWSLQNAAIAAKREVYLANGWSGIELLDVGHRFAEWEHEKTPKKRGGKVFITVSHRGEVACHEGWLTRQEARRSRRNDGERSGETESARTKSARPEVTSALQNYIDLHRHTAVRAALLDHPGVALRLMLAHAIAGSGHWAVAAEPQRAQGEGIKASIARASAQAPFAASRAACLALLNRPDDESFVTDGNGDEYQTALAFARLLELSDAEVAGILTYVMAETMASGSAVVEAVGAVLKVETGAVWQPDEAFFDLIRDKQIANAMLAEVAGQSVADGNVTEKVKTQKQIVRDCLAGENGRPKVEDWLPGWLAFPVRPYTARGGLNAAERWERVRALFDARA